MKLRSVYLENFRSYKKLRIKVDNIKFIILTGKNGIGKTNLLEAISFLSPGKGFKNCKLEEVFNNQKKLKQCSIFSVIENKNEKNEIGIGFSNKILNNKIFTKKVIQVNGKNVEALHFNFSSSDEKLDKDKKLNTDVWYDESTLNWVKASFKKKGNWEYKLVVME